MRSERCEHWTRRSTFTRSADIDSWPVRWTDPRLPGAVSDAAAAAAEAEGDEDAASAAEAADPSSSSTAAGKNHLGDSASDGTPSWAKCGAGPGQSPGLSRACRLVAGLVARCWEHEPSNRPSAHEGVERLETILSAIRNDGGEGDDGFDSYHRDSVGDGGGGQLGAEREGGGGGGVGGVSGVGGGTCLNEDCGVVACPMSTSTGATGATGADDPSPSSSNLPTLGGRAASLVEDVRACAKAGVMCANLPKRDGDVGGSRKLLPAWRAASARRRRRRHHHSMKTAITSWQRRWRRHDAGTRAEAWVPECETSTWAQRRLIT